MTGQNQSSFSLRKQYGGVEYMRVIAAILVVAVHTGPLLSWGEDADFWLTGALARLAVPFFFMASGFFFFRKLSGNTQADIALLLNVMRKVALLYAVAIIIYLPFNVYKGDFGSTISAGGMFKSVLMDGTFYHLWYLPALIIGMPIVYALHRLLPGWGVAAAAALLYGIGLLGDSYYGLAIGAPALKQMYDVLFQWFDYTRNGFFFAPPFLVMGLLAAKREQALRSREKRHAPGYVPRRVRHSASCVRSALLAKGALFAAILALSLLEAYWLKEAGWPRHDSMYVLLLPAVWILFQLALEMPVRYYAWLGSFSLWLYVLHPAGIVGVRAIARLAGAEKLLIGQSLIHFGAVALISSSAALAMPLIVETCTRLFKNRFRIGR
ncbi:acyltransferase family protein [Paenibacillus sp. CAU 1782]